MPQRPRRGLLPGGLIALWLTACAQPPLAPPTATANDPAPPTAIVQPATAPIELQGQMGVKLGAWGQEPARGMSFGFFFQGQVERGSLSLMTPLGSQVAQVDWTPTSATLRRIGPGGGEDIQRGSVDELAETALGEALPLQTLVHWMQGRPDPALPHHAQPETSTFEQLGWQVDTRERAQGRILATRQSQPGLRDARIQVRLDP